MVREDPKALKARILRRQPHAVYRMYSGDGVLLYVGCTSDLDRRLTQHILRRDWIQEVARIQLEWHPNRDTARQVESAAIRTEDPWYNVRGKFPGWPIRGVVPGDGEPRH